MQLRSRQEYHTQRSERKDHHRSMVRLKMKKGHCRSDYKQGFVETGPLLSNLIQLPLHKRSEIDDDKYLCQFRRLQVEYNEIYPSGAALNRFTNTWNEHQ